MRTTTVLITALALTLPALQAGAFERVPLHQVASQAGGQWSPARLSLNLYQPVTNQHQIPARRNSPAAAPSTGASSSLDPTVQGAISLEARHLQGSEAIEVEGNAPAGSPVTITLLATVSPDVPTILVSRHDIITDVNGRFGAVIPIASAFERGTSLKILATSASGAQAQAQLITGAPNEGVSVPLDSH